MRTIEEQTKQGKNVLDLTSGLFAEFETPVMAVATAMTLLDTFIESHPDQEERTIETLKTAIEVRDSVIELSGKILFIARKE